MPTNRVLLVEDEEDLREVMADVLENAGYAVAQAANGAEALDTLRRAPAPDLIVLDLMMPVMDGGELLAVLGAESALKTIPVVVATAVSRDVPTGARCVLKKPFTTAELLACVGASLPSS